jgi:hypothetical protein
MTIVTKPWYFSKALWLNLLSVLIVGVSMSLDLAGVLQLSVQEVAIGTVLLAVLNAIVRVYTALPIAGTPGVKALRHTTQATRELRA